MADKKADAIKERLKVNIEKLKMVSTIIILITGGLIGLLFKEADSLIKVILFLAGMIADMLFLVYLWKLNDSIKNLLNSMERKNA